MSPTLHERSWRARLAIAAAIAAVAVPALALGPHWLRPEATKAQIFLVFGGLALIAGFPEVKRGFARFAGWQQATLLAPLAIALLSGLAAERTLPAFALAAQGGACLALALVIAGAPRNLRELALHAIVATGTLVAAIGLLERCGISLGLASNSSITEPVSTFGNAAFASELVLPSAFLCLRAALRARSRSLGVLFGALHVVHALYLALADTMTAVIAYDLVALSGLVYLYVAERPRARALAPAVIAGLVCFHLPLAAELPARPEPPTANAAASSVAPASAAPAGAARDFRTLDVRVHTWKAILASAFPASPWLGLGAGSFDEMFPPYRAAEERTLSRRAEGSTIVNTAHNDALQALAETGLLGLLALLAAGGVLLLATLRGSATDRTWLYAAAAAVLVNGLARTPLLANAPVAATFAILSGALISRGGRSRHLEPGLASLAPALLLGALTTSGAVFGAVRVAAALETAAAIAELPPPGAPLDDGRRARIGSQLDVALALAPEDYRSRLLRARLSTDGSRALEEIERARIDAPYDLQAWALEAELSFRAASMLDDPRPALLRSRTAHSFLLALEPENDRTRANALLTELHLARLDGDAARALGFYQELVALRPERRAELEPVLLEIRTRAAKEALEAKRYDEAARWLAEDATARGDEDALLDHIERLAKAGEISGARALARVAIPGPDRRERYEQLSELLAQRALDAWQIGKGAAMKEALEAAVALAVDRAARERELGKAWMKRALDANATDEARRLATFYGQKLTIDGHESAFLAALARRDATSAEASLQSLSHYSVYAEQPIAAVDRAALLHLQGRLAEAQKLVRDAVAGELKTLGSRRDALLRALFADDPVLSAEIERLAR